MDNEIKPKEAKGAVEAAGEISKVSKKESKTKSTIIWVLGGLIAIVLVIALSHGHRDKKPTFQAQTISFNNYKSELNMDLARLKSKEGDDKASPAEEKVNYHVPVTQDNLPAGSPSYMPVKESKAYLARQNAPSSVYSGDSPATTTTTQGQSGSVQEATLAGQGANASFGNQNTQTSVIQAQKIPHPGFVIASGEFIHAVLETAVNSDLPGLVRAEVSRPVYSYTGEKLLIPAGSRLIGQYSSGIVQGQNRIMVVWNRVILPNGIAVQINSSGTDALGVAGQGADSLNTHFFAKFGQASLLSIIGASVSTAGVGSQDQYNSAAIYRAAIADSFQQSAQQSLQNTVAMSPTIKLNQGANINVFVAHDLSFYQVLVQKHQASGSSDTGIIHG